MKRKGFTLIELLAVIVILAIIALIATPIVLHIIENSKEASVKRSVKNYLDGVEQAVSLEDLNGKVVKNGKYYIMNNGNICSNELIDNKCSETEIKIDVKGNKPTSGIIFITDGTVTGDTTLIMSGYYIKYDEDKNEYSLSKIKTYDIELKLTNINSDSKNEIQIKNIETKTLIFKAPEGYNLPDNITVRGAQYTWDKTTGTLVLSKATDKVIITINGVEKPPVICKAVTTATTGNVPNGNFNYGDEYVCDLGDDDPKTFFVLETINDEVSLIMNANIRTNGKAVTSSVSKGFVNWVTKEDYIAAGGEESNWDKLSGTNTLGPLTANKALIERTANWNKITDKTKIKLPTANQIATASGKNFYSSQRNYTKGLAIWLYDYLNNSSTPHTVYGVYAYWTSTTTFSSSTAWEVEYAGELHNDRVVSGGSTTDGIRPVITISKSQLE